MQHVTADAQLLTSDRPVTMSATIGESDAYLFLPIGPKTAFVAVNNLETQRRVRDLNEPERVEALNCLTASHAAKYVYGRDEALRELVDMHISTKQQRTLLERLIDFQARKYERRA